MQQKQKHYCCHEKAQITAHLPLNYFKMKVMIMVSDFLLLLFPPPHNVGVEFSLFVLFSLELLLSALLSPHLISPSRHLSFGLPIFRCHFISIFHVLITIIITSSDFLCTCPNHSRLSQLLLLKFVIYKRRCVFCLV